MNKERGNCLVIIIGVVFVLFLVGFFNSERAFWDTVNFKRILNLPCGVTINHPKFIKDEKVAWPLTLDGYINGCGWTANGLVAGTAQVLDARGQPVTQPKVLEIPADSRQMPFFFETTFTPQGAPTTDTGTILITSNAGLLYTIPLKF